MNDFEIPELKALRSPTGIVRVPPEIDIPVTPRVMRLIDSPTFRRLVKISQLGLVSQVYPGATHSRFEHSLGVYRNSLLFLQRLGSQPDFKREVSIADAELLIVGGLLHDLGHWPFCHAIEDMRLEGVLQHEQLARQLLLDGDLAKILETDWKISVDSVAELLAPADKKSQSIRF